MIILNNFLASNRFPESIKREIENIQKLILPLARKTSKYVFWTFPLIGVAVLNLIFLLFFSSEGNNYMLMFIYAVIGAIGFALWKEAKLNRQEIQNIGVQYMNERIKKSVYVMEDKKKQYIHLINEKPAQAMEFFIRFLQEEDRLRRLQGFQMNHNDEG